MPKKRLFVSELTLINLRRAYRSGASYKHMSAMFNLTSNQISWYLSDIEKRQHYRRKENVVVPIRKPTPEFDYDPAQHEIAKKALKKEIEQAKRESKTSPVYRPAPDKVWD